MKQKILKILKEESAVISGEKLSKKLGISRVSVWKHISGLKDMGYEIQSTPKGYRLDRLPDALFPWEFPGRSENIHYFPVATSTMEIARNLARKGCPDFTVVIAEQQDKGRGRLTRSWVSSEGGLYFTAVLRPEIPPPHSYKINFLASLTMAKCLSRLFGIEARVKWPNDILVGGKKIVGMLSEMETESDMLSYINLGIGINVNNDPPQVGQKVDSIKNILGKEVSRKKLLAHFLDDLEDGITPHSLDTVIPRWKEHTMTIGRDVKIVTTRDETHGRALDVDDDGALLLELSDGSVKKIVYGDCFHQPKE